MEFENVYILNCCEEVIPHANATDIIREKTYLICDLGKVKVMKLRQKLLIGYIIIMCLVISIDSFYPDFDFDWNFIFPAVIFFYTGVFMLIKRREIKKKCYSYYNDDEFTKLAYKWIILGVWTVLLAGLSIIIYDALKNIRL
ncbi:hypothetical protein PTZ02_01885 [Clostridium sp. 'White wine YQ']|nr:hypothetical protein [Clostridium sp. 'White wine YQ']MDD7792998.1 hypothetical protein [Clostridium sp. 'White wine YQ']